MSIVAKRKKNKKTHEKITVETNTHICLYSYFFMFLHVFVSLVIFRVFVFLFWLQLTLRRIYKRCKLQYNWIMFWMLCLIEV